MLPSETMIWQPEFTDKTLSRKPGAVQVEAAQQAGVATATDFAIFQNHGYQGLYGGLDQKAIHQRKGLKKNQKILDHMGSTELAANLFRATQTEEKLKRDGVNSKQQANTTHFDVGSKVMQTI
ncbi:putative dNA-damage-inducible protein D [Escherichia coli 2-011-08_S3_C3]|nr:putative dNA-damage-inducible protein D [Escherichia coli 2-011-08_S3_C3]KEM98769.1 putative dNA-damage-inducible protein D [Escherichia coli 7-233-03_S3_C3]